jgi:hypothetical protein
MLAGSVFAEMSAPQATIASGAAPFERPASPFRFAALFVPLIALTVPVFWIQARVPEAPISTATSALVVLSALANVIVIAYHYLVPLSPQVPDDALEAGHPSSAHPWGHRPVTVVLYLTLTPHR